MTAGSTTLTSAGASFATTDEGKLIAVAGAVAANVALVTRIATRVSATQVTVETAAQRAVSGATFAYGGATRVGIRMSAVSGIVAIRNNIIRAGVSSGLASEPDASGVEVANTGASGVIRLENNGIIAPTTTGTVPAGLRQTAATGILYDRHNRISGFTAKRVGVQSFKGGMAYPIFTASAQDATPSATINTFGTEIFFDPTGDHFLLLSHLSVEWDGISAETLTLRISAYRYDVAENTYDISATGNAVQNLVLGDLINLVENNAPIRRFGFKAKSSKGSSTARARVSAMALSE
jgi:hypothetical protein